MDRNFDMFMKLTDHILFIIISFLSFKEAARTCVLSKRWRHVWRATKRIEFDERFFVSVGESDESQETQRRVFIHFVRQWMENYREPNIESFQLTCLKPGDFRGEMELCIAFAIKRNVKVLGLDFSDPTWREDDLDHDHAALFDLPLNVYGHAVLESLKLFSCSFRLPEFMNFGALKDLSLGWLELRMSVIEAILVNCRLLESLSLNKCWNIEQLDIKGPNLRLRSLVIDKCKFLEGWYAIEAPNLRFLKYSGAVGFFEVEINRDCMEEADLDFGLEFEFNEALGDVLCGLLEQLYPIRILTVCSYMLQV
ncbi:putative F-box protein At3g29830 [Alnus glutinosa]|uniref:putative F-box protein At3g29830 n=1 Tax=Alnus glutinosa TaxID=3517 RepID=UPI002D79DC4C|nr:putative F-box protein At3g29830 [Alnus glutinosa]